MNTNKLVLIAGIAAVAIPLYDNVAVPVNAALSNSSSGAQLPFIWRGSVASYFSEMWLAILGGLLILLAAFVPLG